MSLEQLTLPFNKIIVLEDEILIREGIKGSGEDLGVPVYCLGVDLDIEDFVHFSDDFLHQSFIFSDMNLKFDLETLRRMEKALGESPTCSQSFGHNCCENLTSKVCCMFYRYLVSRNFPIQTNFSFMTLNSSDYDKQIIFENGGKGRLLLKTNEFYNRIQTSLPKFNPGDYWLNAA